MNECWLLLCNFESYCNISGLAEQPVHDWGRRDHVTVWGLLPSDLYVRCTVSRLEDGGPGGIRYQTGRLQLFISSRFVLFKGRRKRESKYKKQETKRFSTFTVSRLRHSETKKILLDSRIKFLAKHVWNSQSTIYLKSQGCVHGLQNEMSLINFSTMFY